MPRAGAAALYAGMLAVYVALRLHAVAGVEPRRYPDSGVYLRMAGRPLASAELWAGSRPAVVPLLYKVVGREPAAIVAAQWGLSVLAWALLAGVAARATRSRALRPLVFGGLLAFALTGPVTQWDAILLSESVSLSLTALLVACGLGGAGRWTAGRAALLCGTAIALAWTRDVYAYLLLVLAGVAAAAALLGDRPRRRRLAVAAALAVAFCAADVSAVVGERWLMPALNAFGERILPVDDRRARFEARGMPVSPALLRLTGPRSTSQRRAVYQAPELRPFRAWWAARGRREYVRFLVSSPGYLVGGPLADAPRLLAARVRRYTPAGFAPVAGGYLDAVVFPARPAALGAWALGLVAAAAVAVRRGRRPPAAWVVPLVLLASVPPLALVVWHGDASEVDRHALPVAVHLRLGLLLALALAADAPARNPSEAPTRAGPG